MRYGLPYMGSKNAIAKATAAIQDGDLFAGLEDA